MTLTQTYLKSVLDYNQNSGIFTWKFRADQRPQWNAKWAGKSAGAITDKGYIRIYIDGKAFLAHRLAILWVTGTFPSAVVDHKDRNKGNNAWSNLRICSQQLNSVNRPVDSRSSTGVTGVYLDKKTGRWWARIIVSGKTIGLGRYDTLADASAARKAAEAKYYPGWL